MQSASQGRGFLFLEIESRVDAFVGDLFEGLVECDKEMDSRGIRGLGFFLGERVEPSETEVVISRGVGGEFFEFRKFSDDDGEPWRHAEGFSAGGAHHCDIAFVELQRVCHEGTDGVDEEFSAVFFAQGSDFLNGLEFAGARFVMHHGNPVVMFSLENAFDFIEVD